MSMFERGQRGKDLPRAQFSGELLKGYHDVEITSVGDVSFLTLFAG